MREIWSITAVYIAVIALLFSSLLSALYNGGLRLYRTPVDLPLLLFCILSVCSFFTSVYPYAGREVMYKMITCLALFYFIVNTQRSTKEIYRLCRILVVFNGIYAMLGLVWTVGGLPGLKIFSKGNYDISLFFFNHNHFAGYLELTVWLAVGMATVSRGAGRVLLFGAGIFMATAVVFSLSRGGIIGLFAGLVFYLSVSVYVKKRKKSLLFLVSFALLTLAVLVWLGLEPVVERMKTLEDLRLAGRGRLDMWQGTLRMIFDRPVSGWGPGAYQFAFPPYQSESMAKYLIDHAHNDYLELAAETGLSGLAAAFIVLLVFFISCLKRLAAARIKYYKPIGVGALASCFSFLVHALTDFNFHVPSNAILFSVMAGIAVLAADKAAGKKRESPGSDIRFGRIGKTVCLVIACPAVFLSCTAVLNPFWSNSSLQKAQEYLKSGEYERAAAAVEKAIRIDPDNAEIMRIKGDILLTQKNVEEELKKNLTQALGWYDKAITNCAVNGNYFARKAAVLERLGRVSEAEHAYKRAVQYAPLKPSAYFSLAVLCIKQHRFDESSRYARRFLELGKPHELTRFLDILWGAGMRYDTLKDMIPKTAVSRRAFATYLFNKERSWLALQELELAFILEPTVDNALVHIHGLLRNKDFTVALTKIEDYLNIFPESIRIHEQKAVILERLGRNQEAISVYQELIGKLAYQKKSIKYYIRIAQLYTKDKQYEKAVVVLRQGTGRHPSEGRLYYQLGIYFQIMKETDQAVATFRKAISLDYTNAGYRYQLGEQYQRSGLYQIAVDRWKECLDINPNFVQCKTAIIKVKKELGLNSDLEF